MAKVTVVPEVVETKKVVLKEKTLVVELSLKEADILITALGGMQTGEQTALFYAMGDAMREADYVFGTYKVARGTGSHFYVIKASAT